MRFCFLKKEEEDERFDFCLRQEEANSGHVVRQVKPGGLAYRRGLREGDRVLEVNGIYVEDMEHLRVRLGVPAWVFASPSAKAFFSWVFGKG